MAARITVTLADSALHDLRVVRVWRSERLLKLPYADSK